MADDTTESPPPEQPPLTREELENLGLKKELLQQIEALVNSGIARRTALSNVMQQGLQVLQRSVDAQREEVALTQQRLEAANDLNSKIELGNTLRNQQVRLLETAARAAAQEAVAAGEGATAERDRVRELQQGLDAYRKQTRAIKNIDSGGRQWLKTLTGISQSHRDSLTYSTMIGAKWKDLGGNIMNSARSMEFWGDVLGSSLQKIQEVTIATVKTVSSLNAQYSQQTGFVDANSAQLEGNWRALKKQFAGLQDVQAARTALMSQGSRFISLGQAEQNELIRLGTTLKQVGVDMGDFLKTVNYLQNGLGMGVAQVTAFENRLHRLGQEVGFSTMQMSREWAQSQSILAKYGQDSERVFNELTRASKATGIATGELIGITNQFVTFEGAANIVGKFNALLGGPYLNTIQMVYAKDHERLTLLRQVFKQAGLNWGQMSEHEQLSYAMAAGIKDMAQAAQLFGDTDAEFRKHQMEQRTLAELARESKDVFDRFKVSMMQLTVALGPLLNGLSSLADWLARVLPDSTEGMRNLVIGLGIAYTSLTALIRGSMSAMIQKKAVQSALGATTATLTVQEAANSAATANNTLQINLNTGAKARNLTATRALMAGLGGLGAAFAGVWAGRKVAAKTGSKAKGRMAGIGIGALAGAGMGAMAGGIPGALIGGAVGGIGAAIPKYQRGGRHRGGPMIVGDRKDRNMRGAEIVAPRGTNIISAQQTGEILSAAQINKEAMGVLVSSIGRLTNKMEALGATVGTLRAKRPGAAEVEKTVVLNVDGTTLGSVVVDVTRDRHEVGLVSR